MTEEFSSLLSTDNVRLEIAKEERLKAEAERLKAEAERLKAEAEAEKYRGLTFEQKIELIKYEIKLKKEPKHYVI